MMRRADRIVTRCFRCCRSLFFGLICALAAASAARAAGGDIVWQYRDLRPGAQQAVASVVDSSGSAIIAGFRNSAGGVDDDYWTVKVKGDGTGTDWQVGFDRAGSTDRITAVTLDGDSNVIVTGFVTNGATRDIHTVKYDGATGTVIWAATFNGPANGNDTGMAVGTDGAGNVYVGGVTQNAGSDDDFILLKYSAAGPNPDGSPAWQVTYGYPGGGNDQVAALAVGPDGVAVTGMSQDGTAFRMATMKYGLDGQPLWPSPVRKAAVGNAEGRKVRIDAAGNVIATGSAANDIDIDLYTVKYNSANGTPLWETIYNGAYDDEPYSLELDPGGDVYVTGYTWTLTGTNDFYTARYNGATGGLVWQQLFNAGDDSTDVAVATSMTVGSSNDLFVTGYTAFDGNYDFQTIKYKRDNGNQLWRQTFDGAAHKSDRPVGVAVTPGGKVLVSGWSDNGSDLDCYVITYDAGAINAPTLLTATTLSASGIRLEWADNSDNEEGFTLERLEEGTYTPIVTPGLNGTVGPNVTTYTDTDLPPDRYYYYRVKATNQAIGDSHYSNVARGLTVFVTFVPPAWSYTYNNPDNMDDYANAIAVGPDNHPVVTGYSQRTASGFDYHTVKLDRDTRQVIWSDLYDDADSELDVAKCIAVDSGNNVAVSGFSQLFNSAAQKNINSIFTIKYRADAPPIDPPVRIWTAQYNGPGAIDDRATAIATTTDNDNNIVVVGYGKNAANNDDIYVVKYLADGTLAWAATPFDGNGGNDFPSAVAVAPDGNVWVTGASARSSGETLYNFFTAKYNGVTGERIWADVYSVTPDGGNYGNSIAIDAAGDAYVAGYAVSGTDRDIYTIKYSGAGTVPDRIWEQPHEGHAAGDDSAVGVRVDPIDGEIVVVGTTYASPGDHDVTLLRYTAAGALVAGWPKTLLRPDHDDYAAAVALDRSGNINIAGDTSNGLTMDIFMLSYDHTGTMLRATIFNGEADGNDESSAIAVNRWGESFLSGYATNNAGNADYVVLKQVTEAVLAPAPFTAVPHEDSTRISLSWMSNTPGATFNLWRSPGSVYPPGNWTQILTDAGPATVSHEEESLTPGTSYCYRIEAVTAAGSSRRLVTCATTTLPPPVPDQLTIVSATAIDVTWPDVPGSTGYRLERMPSGGSWTVIADLPAGTLVYHDTEVTAGTVYFYRLRVRNEGGLSLPGPVRIAPVLNLLSGVTSAKIDLSWPPVSGATGYTIERSEDGIAWTVVATPLGSETTLSDSSVVPATAYSYRLRAVTAEGTSSASVPQSATTRLNTPAVTSAVAASTTEIALAWSDPNGGTTVNETGVTVEHAACTSTSPSACPVSDEAYWSAWIPVSYAADTSSATVGSLEPGRTYRFRVRATRSGADSAASPVVATTTNLTGPTGVSVQAITSVSVRLAWNNVLGETNYKVEQNGVLRPEVISRDVTSTLVSGLSPENDHTFRIMAYNGSSSAFSDPVQARTLAAGPVLNSVTAVSQTEVDLTWTTMGSILKYEIYRGTYLPPNTLIASPGPGDTAHADITGVAGTTYYYGIRAQRTDGIFTDFSTFLSATTVPAAPSYLTATGVDPTRIDLNWGYCSGATGYTFQHKERSGADCTAGEWTSVPKSGINSTSHSVTGLTPGTAYCFRVNAVNAAGSSPFTSPLTMLPAPVLNPPGDITPASVTLTWGPNIDGNSGYVVERSSDNLNFSQLAGVNANVLTYTDGSVAADSTYYYRLRTLFSSLRSVPSLSVSATTLASTAPVLNTPGGITTSQITLSWNNIPGNLGYKIERSPDGLSWTTIFTQSQDQTTYTNTGLTAGTRYYYRVSTRNSATSFSDPSNVQSAVTTPAFPTPAAPNTNVTLAAVTEGRIDLKWRVVRGATNYKVMRSVGPAGPWTEAVNLPIGYSTLYCGLLTAPTIGCPVLEPAYASHADNGLSENTQYCYQIKAWNATGGDSAPSDNPPVCLKTPSVRGPAITGVTATSSMSIQLSWTYDPAACSPDPCEVPDGFEVWRENPAKQFVPWKTLFNATSYVDRTGVEPQKTYSYKVRAFRGADLSPFSSSASATTPPYAAGDDGCAAPQTGAPQITSVPATAITEGENYSYAVTTTGVGPFTYLLASRPNGMTISAEGAVTWQPAHHQIGNQNVSVRATDAEGRFAEQNFTVTVLRLNQLPMITSTPVTTAATGVEYSYTVTATDADGDSLTFSLATAPDGMSITSGGTISWLPAANQSGPRPVSVRADDGIGMTSHDFTIEVAANQPPVITSTAPTAVTEEEAYTYQVTATDPNSLPLTYTLTGAPATMTISGTGLIDWTPDLLQAERPDPTVTVTVRNSNNLAASQTFTIVVADFPRPPVVTSTPPPASALGTTYSYQIVATDPDNLPLSYHLPLNLFPPGMTVSAAGLVTWTPTSGQLGSHPVTVRVDDGNVSTLHSFSVLVAVAPSVPTINPTPNIDTGCGGTVPVTLSWNPATAPDNHPVQYAVSLDGGAQTQWQSGTTYIFSTSGGHSWKVKSKDPVTGLESAWSATGSFIDHQSCGGSCPDLYAWDGSRFVFESDLYGSGKLGLAITGGYLKPNPNDYYLLRTMPAPNADGKLELRLVEDRWETDYLDSAHLYAIDIPEGRDLYSEIPIWGAGYTQIESMVHTVSNNPAAPVSIIHIDNGADVSAELAASDGNYLVLSENRDLFEWHTLELDLGSLTAAGAVKLIVDAQSVFPSVSTSRVGELAIDGLRTLVQVIDSNGNWVTVPKEVLQMPVPKEFRRPFVLDLSGIFPTPVYKVRLGFMFKTYIDSIRVDTTEDEEVIVTEVPLADASLRYHGTNSKTSNDEIFGYTYDQIADYGYRFMPGNYTRYGSVAPLLSAVDDMFALFGTGDELRMTFHQPTPVPPGAARRFMLYTNGYYKSYNNKSIAPTVEPLPFAAMSSFPYSWPETYPTDEAHRQYRLLYNTRQEGQ